MVAFRQISAHRHGDWLALAVAIVAIPALFDFRLGPAALAAILIASLVILLRLGQEPKQTTDDASPTRSRVWIVGGVGLLIGADLALFYPIVGVGILGLTALAVVARFTKGELTNVMAVYVVMLFLIPSAYSVGPFAVTVARAFALFAFGLWGAAKFLPYANVGRGITRIGLANWIFAFAVLISFTVSTLSAQSESQSRGANRMLTTLGLAAMTAIIIADAARGRRTIYRLLGLAVAAAGVMGLIAILEYGGIFDPGNYPIPGLRIDGELKFVWQRSGFPRVSGTAQHPIEFGIVCAVMLPIALHYVYYARGPLTRSGAILCSAMLAIGIPLSLSRSALAAVAVSMTFWFLTATARQRAQIMAIGVAALIAFAIATPGLLDTLAGLSTGSEGSASLETREKRREDALELGLENPILGQGIGSYASEGSRSIGIVDNLYFDLLIEQGIAGLLAFLLLTAQAIAVALWLRYRSVDQSTKHLLSALTGGIAGIAVSGWGLTILNYPMVTGVLFLFIGSIGAIERSVAPPDYEMQNRSPLGNRV